MDYTVTDNYEDEKCLAMNDRHTLVPLFVLEILELNTNPKKQFSQEELIRRLDEYPYSITIERRALSADLKLLMAEFPTIRKGATGVYYDRNAA